MLGHRGHGRIAGVGFLVVLTLTFLLGMQLAPSVGGAAEAESDLSIDKGREIYHASCGTCHMSTEGVGRFAPPLRAEGIAWFGTVDVMYEYVSTYMPLGAGGSLTEAEYWAVIAFMLDETELLPADVPLKPGVLASLSLRPNDGAGE